jgi:hypothetical protein
MDNFYNNPGRRIFDFLLGALGVWAFNLFIGNIIFGFISQGLKSINLNLFYFGSVLFPILILIVNIGTLRYFSK